MRIRKNAKLSQTLQQSHVCQLNQSPWDVIPFGLSSDQLEVDDSFTGTGSPGDSIGAVESMPKCKRSVASMMDGSTKLEDLCIKNGDEMEKDGDRELNDNGGKRIIGLSKGTKKKVYCQKNDGKGWQCKKEAKEDHSFCDYHFGLLRSYNISVEPPAGGRRARDSRPAKKAAAGSSNPYEFYYYSGFGPLWGKRRGDRGGGTEGSKIAEEEAGNRSITSSPSSSETDDQKFDYLDEDDDEDDEEDDNGDSGKKRMRKPVKARSLKSLM